MSNEQKGHGNITMKITGYFFFGIFILVLVFSIGLIITSITHILEKGTSSFDFETVLLALSITVIVCVFTFILGKYFYKYSKRNDVAELTKEFIVCRFVNGIFGISFFAWALGWTLSIGTHDLVSYTISLSLTTSSLLLIIAFIFTIKQKIYPSYLLMIISGIIVFPAGIVPLILGFRLKKYK